MSKFNKDMTIGEVLETNPKAEAVFMGFGMSCCGCPVSQMETLEEAASVHDIELELMLEKLNELDDEECSCGCEDEHCGCEDCNCNHEEEK